MYTNQRVFYFLLIQVPFLCLFSSQIIMDTFCNKPLNLYIFIVSPHNVRSKSNRHVKIWKMKTNRCNKLFNNMLMLAWAL